MKVTIDTEKQTITPLEEVTFNELNNLIESLGGGQWTVIPKIESRIITIPDVSPSPNPFDNRPYWTTNGNDITVLGDSNLTKNATGISNK